MLSSIRGRWFLTAAVLALLLSALVYFCPYRLFSPEGVDETQGTGELVRHNAAVLAFMFYVLLLSVYFYYEWRIRSPLLRLTRAMEAEDRGDPGAPAQIAIGHVGPNETRALFNGFATMRARLRRLQAILDNARDAIITLDPNGVIDSFNHGAELLFGYNASEVAGKHITVLVPSEQVNEPGLGEFNPSLRALTLAEKSCNAVGMRKNGDRIQLSLKLNTLPIEDGKLFVAVCSDIGETREIIDRLRAMAERDPLTGLYNRYFLMETLNRVIAHRHNEPDTVFALTYINLDHFKFINDTLGHQSGDAVLKAVTGILNSHARKSDVLARVGADEFAVLQIGLHNRQLVEEARKLQNAIAQHAFQYNNVQIDVSCSIGITPLTDQIGSTEEFLARGDIACHIAKQEGRNRIHLFGEADQARIQSMSTDLAFVSQIKKAIEQNRFLLMCQPITDVYSLEVRSYEILLRMLDEEGKPINPSEFLPSAERYGLMMEIDRWVFSEAIQILARLRHSGVSAHFSINLSAQSIMEPMTLEGITHLIKTHQLNSHALTFEVTESAAIENLQAARFFLGKLRELGCQTALDDFGVGYSSFAYLKELPVDYVKIDGSFVKDMAGNRVNKAMVKSMNDVAHAMGKSTVAEFVENEKILRLLKETGVDMGQGYFLGKPIALTQLLQEFSSHTEPV